MQRLRFTYTRGADGQYISHLDMARLWERALRRARLPIVYSQGFTPHARISFAAPLAVGVTADAELVDLFLAEPLAPAEARARLAAQLPPGLALTATTEVDLSAPSVQSQVRAAVYVAEFEEAVPELGERVAALLARDAVPYERKREGKVKRIDLRPYVEALTVDDAAGALTLRLKLDNGGSVRPDEVLDALGLGKRPVRLHRACLVLAPW
ncbi:MAG: TIGR03936 family radical SAM-associated protein [Chloroflexota bacterium]